MPGLQGILVLGGGAVLLLSLGGIASGYLSAAAAFPALLLYGISALLLRMGWRSADGILSFGAANTVTLARLVLICLFAGVAFDVLAGGKAAFGSNWIACGLVALALALDGLDGWLARRQGAASEFGARFDMEVDALLIMILSLIAWGAGKAGIWVIGIGLARYVFLAAGVLWPRLNRTLPPLLRRKAVCVAAGVGLATLLAPLSVPPISVWIAGSVLALVLSSFAADCLWLMLRWREPPAPRPLH